MHILQHGGSQQPFDVPAFSIRQLRRPEPVTETHHDGLETPAGFLPEIAEDVVRAIREEFPWSAG